MRSRRTGLLFLACAIVLACGTLRAEEKVREVTYSPHADQLSCQMNMGPTGARAWMRGYHFVVMSVDRGSPAHNALVPGDTVTAADGTPFGPNRDPRITLGNAIGRAEADGAPLKLTVLREGVEKEVSVALPKLGAYSETWPRDCEKSRRILDAACRSLWLSQLPSGEIVTDGGMGTRLGGLLFLASADPVYLDSARRAAYSVAAGKYPWLSTSNNWLAAYGGILLAEYYLATGDDTVLPTLQVIADLLARGQMVSGGWGHTSPGGAYGTLNQVGVICAIALVLADECGVNVDPKAKNRALWFFGRFAELGAVPYGDHTPTVRHLDSNGRSASAGVLMHLAGREKLAKGFVESVAMSSWMREEGHTGGFFSLTWGPLAAWLSSPEQFQTFMAEQEWYYNLARTWRGELVLLPYHEALTRFDSSFYIGAGWDFTTGGMGLAFALPNRHLRILGAPRSIFSGRAAPQGLLGKARTHYLAREWKACDEVLQQIRPRTLANDEEERWFEQLAAARALVKADVERVLLEVESNLTEGAHYRAQQQYEALKRRLGDELDERFVTLDKRFEGASYYLGQGKEYYDALRGLQSMSVRSWVPAGQAAHRLVRAMPSAVPPVWEPLSPVSDLTPQTWRSLLLSPDASLPDGWAAPGFDDTEWIAHEGIFTRFDGEKDASHPKGAIAARRVFGVKDAKGTALRVRLRTVRPAHTEVYLNGVRIVNAVRGQRGGYASILLDDSVFGLLRKGENLLAVTSDEQGSGGNHLDVGLEVNRTPRERKVWPPLRADALTLANADGVDNAMRVRETKDEKAKALRESFSEKSVEGLLEELRQSVAYRRWMAEEALAAKGVDALKEVMAHFSDKDWKVRAGACNTIAAAAGRYRETPESEEWALVQSALPALRKALDDPHFWVRARSASALRSLGEPARVAIPDLLERVRDGDAWVRAEALRSIAALHEKPGEALEAARIALKQYNTAFTVPRIAYSILKKYPGKGDGRLEALATTLREPPHGGGGRTLLKPLLEMSVELDPEGTVMIPVLIEGVRSGSDFSRQQAGPRGKILELLGQYGEKAKAAIPVLLELLGSDNRDDKRLHEAVRKTLPLIGGEAPPQPEAEVQ